MAAEKVKPNLLLLSLMAALAAAVGSTPYLLFVGALWLVPVFALIAAVTMGVYAQKHRTAAIFEPTFGEWISAGWSLILNASMFSFALIYYALMYWATRLVIFILGFFDILIDVSWDHTLGLYVSAFFAVFLYAAFLGNAPKFLGELYPRLSGVRTPYYALWSKYKFLILAAVVGGLSAVAAIVILDLREWYWIFGCSLLLLYTSLPIATSGEKRESQRKKGLEAVRLLINAAGWNLRPMEAPGDPELDPFTVGIDFVAEREGESLLVEVVAAEVDWTVASGLQTAARMLESGSSGAEKPSTKLRPLLVLLSERVDESINRFRDLEKFDVAHVPEPAVQKIYDARNDSGALAELAKQMIPATGGADAPNS